MTLVTVLTVVAVVTVVTVVAVTTEVTVVTETKHFFSIFFHQKKIHLKTKQIKL